MRLAGDAMFRRQKCGPVMPGDHWNEPIPLGSVLAGAIPRDLKSANLSAYGLGHATAEVGMHEVFEIDFVPVISSNRNYGMVQDLG